MKRLGLCVSHDAVRGILLRRGRVVWHGCAPLSNQERASVALERLLATMPVSRFGRPAVHVAFGLAHSQVKRLEGLPAVRQPRLLDRIVRENADSFFLRLGARTLVTNVERRPDGSTWAAALDAALLDEIVATLRRRGLSPRILLPFAAAAANAIPTGTWRITDGGWAATLTTIEGALIQACRLGASDAAVPIAKPPAMPALTAVVDAPDFLGAYGVALASAHAKLAWRPPRDAAHVRALSVANLTAATILFVAASSAALAAKGVHAARIAAAAAHELLTFRDAEISAAKLGAELREVTGELDRIRQFEATRGRVTLLLGALSEALPDSTAIVNLRIDSLDANFIALAPHAADILPQISRLPNVVAPRIVGSVTREVQGSARIERASVRFRRERAAAAAQNSTNGARAQ